MTFEGILRICHVNLEVCAYLTALIGMTLRVVYLWSCQSNDDRRKLGSGLVQRHQHPSADLHGYHGADWPACALALLDFLEHPWRLQKLHLLRRQLLSGSLGWSHDKLLLQVAFNSNVNVGSKLARELEMQMFDGSDSDEDADDPIEDEHHFFFACCG